MSSLSENNVQTLWVVAKLKCGIRGDGEFVCEIVEVEEQGYWAKEYADKRAKHVRELDGLEASVWPVRFEMPLGATAFVPEWSPLPGPVTASNGLELNCYHVPWRDAQPRLSQTVSASWLAWRQQQAELGNLDEAGSGQPSIESLELLYSETNQRPGTQNLPNNPAQLELPFPAPRQLVH